MLVETQNDTAFRLAVKAAEKDDFRRFSRRDRPDSGSDVYRPFQNAKAESVTTELGSRIH